MKFLAVLALLVATQAFAQNDIQELERELTEGKIQAAEIGYAQSKRVIVDEKANKVLKLLPLVIERSFMRASVGNDGFRQDAEEAHTQFVLRYQQFSNEEEQLERKDLQADIVTLVRFEAHLDKLIKDIEAFLK